MLTDELLRFVQREENAGMEFIKRAKSAGGQIVSICMALAYRNCTLSDSFRSMGLRLMPS